MPNIKRDFNRILDSQGCDLERVAELCDSGNIKLDKYGGLTAALRIVDRARKNGLQVMIGCTPARSLSMAAGFPIGLLADFVYLGGYLLLADDVQPAIDWCGGWLRPPRPGLWG
jgi:L-alanine-DL-glutamate epimerase-like enolase superfamily enzyme